MVQRKGELPRKGITVFEEYVEYLYRQMGFGGRIARQCAVCLSCGKFEQTDGKHYPKGCRHCGREYGCEDGEYCMPDFVVIRMEGIANKTPEIQYAVLFVDGEVHSPGTNRAKKDKHQREKLTELGIPWYVVTNFELMNSEVPMLVNFLSAIWYNLAIKRLDVYLAGKNAEKCHSFVKEWEKRHKGDGFGT